MPWELVRCSRWGGIQEITDATPRNRGVRRLQKRVGRQPIQERQSQKSWVSTTRHGPAGCRYSPMQTDSRFEEAFMRSSGAARVISGQAARSAPGPSGITSGRPGWCGALSIIGGTVSRGTGTVVLTPFRVMCEVGARGDSGSLIPGPQDDRGAMVERAPARPCSNIGSPDPFRLQLFILKT